MITPQIPYYDLDNLVLARNNKYDVQGTVLGFTWALMNQLNAMVVNDPNTPPQSPISNAFYPNPNTGQPDIALTYVEGDGKYPTVKIRFYFAPTSWSVKLTFNIEMFDQYRLTITADGIPAVTARFDTSNIDIARLKQFCYSILGTALPIWFDQPSDSWYNGTDPNDYNAPL